MIYAAFSDMHGNSLAFEAGVADAKKRGADKFIILGDFMNGLPFVNVVIELIRGLDTLAVLRGNHGDYLIDYQGEGRSTKGFKQFSLIHWCYDILTRENLEYIASLPAEASLEVNGRGFYFYHNFPLFYRNPKVTEFHTSHFRIKYEESPFTHEEYLANAKAALLSRSDALGELNKLPRGIYFFGHNHIQFNMEHEGKLFINPGSCGFAADCDCTAAYTLLHDKGGTFRVEERRVEYDTQKAAQNLRGSGLFDVSPLWVSVIERQTLTGRDCFSPFLTHLNEVKRSFGFEGDPASDHIWDAAVEAWDAENFKPKRS